MIKLYRILHTPFPLAVLTSGLALGLSSNLMTDVFRTKPVDFTRLRASLFLLVSAMLFSILHAEFARIDLNARSLVYSGGGIPKSEELVEDMLKKRRFILVVTLMLGITAFLIGIAASSGLLWAPPSATP